MRESDHQQLHNELDNFLNPENRKQVAISMDVEAFKKLSDAIINDMDSKDQDIHSEQVFGGVVISPEGDIDRSIIENFRSLREKVDDTKKNIELLVSREEFLRIYGRLRFLHNVAFTMTKCLVDSGDNITAYKRALTTWNAFAGIKKFQESFTAATGFEVDERVKSDIDDKMNELRDILI